jgi:hypothetical protein
MSAEMREALAPRENEIERAKWHSSVSIWFASICSHMCFAEMLQPCVANANSGAIHNDEVSLVSENDVGQPRLSEWLSRQRT